MITDIKPIFNKSNQISAKYQLNLTNIENGINQYLNDT